MCISISYGILYVYYNKYLFKGEINLNNLTKKQKNNENNTITCFLKKLYKLLSK